ncbi:SRPBCC domain-containing protein [Microcoleus sp. FACHB-68]|uniref:SRPBCC domain-containing protein n=1 Tax=Microcoleus sp. FACHB-68 TaxID=2692826 RepID=UPI0016831C2B|nr:SRPBCC domain-containing protein [Microcoleus sp. FACHB-68]MBD1937874.1 SRPBCC domain-containing protein [Microcoleus sp. FACHB-68]
MPSLYVEIEINAPKQRVWQVLIQKDQWLHWNTFLFDREPALPFEQGKEVVLCVQRVRGEEETEFEPVVTLVLPAVCLKWVSAIPGFRHEYIFELQEIGVGRTKYIHRENFSGFLTRVFLPFLRDDEKKGMERMAKELKRYAERS